MSGLTIAYWEKVKITEFVEVEKIIQSWIFQLEKLYEIDVGILTKNQAKRIQNLEFNIKVFVGFLEIMEELGKCYIKESGETADVLNNYFIENNLFKIEIEKMKIEIESLQSINKTLVEEFYKTIKRIKNEQFIPESRGTF